MHTVRLKDTLYVEGSRITHLKTSHYDAQEHAVKCSVIIAVNHNDVTKEFMVPWSSIEVIEL